MAYYKDQEQLVTKENQQMTTELTELRLQLQKISYESKENAITVDSLKESNQELMAELDELKRNLSEMRNTHKDAADGEKEKKKAEKMAEMMSGFDPLVSFFFSSKKEPYYLFTLKLMILFYSIYLFSIRVKSMKKNVKSELH